MSKHSAGLPARKRGGREPTDVDWLRGWGERIRSLLDADNPELLADSGIVYNPDSEAVDAMGRLGFRFTHAIGHIREALDWARTAHAKLVSDDWESIAAFCGDLDILARRIEVGVGAIEADTPDTKPDTGQKILPIPESPLLHQFISKLKREVKQGGVKKVDIARDFLRDNPTAAKNPDSLLRQANRYKHLWDSQHVTEKPDT